MTYQIRKLNENDYPSLLELFQEFAEFEKQADKMTNSIEQMQSESNLINGFVATNNSDEIIGYVIYFLAYFTWIGKSMYMDDLYVKQDYRGNGIGTALINKVIEHAKETKCNKVRWQVSEWNKPAIQFYKSLGAQISPEESNCDLIL